jgi:HPt (histidine-containing phosphotransfer) domain-containing protein
MAHLQKAFAIEFRVRIARLRVLAARLDADKAALDEAWRLAHGLAGSGGTFGYPEVSRIAANLEHLLDPLASTGGTDREARAARLIEHLEQSLGWPCPGKVESTD